MYPDFESIKKCVKCNNPSTSDYSTETSNMMLGNFRYNYVSAEDDINKIEHMWVRCNTCGYAWKENCADAELNVQNSF